MLGLDEARQADARQLLPDAADVDAEGIVVHIDLVVPQVGHQVPPGADGPGVAEEVGQDLELVPGQVCGGLLVGELAAVQVEGGPPPGEGGVGLVGAGPLQQGGDPGQEDGGV